MTEWCLVVVRFGCYESAGGFLIELIEFIQMLSHFISLIELRREDGAIVNFKEISFDMRILGLQTFKLSVLCKTHGT